MGKDDLRLPAYAVAQNYQSLKQSSFDRAGGNADRWPLAVGETKEVFQAAGPGVISHIWFTIAAPTTYHLKEIVLRMYWDGQAKPSVEVPVGDFFGLNLGQYNIYQSAFLNCSSVKALNCYFAMPFAKSARITVTNEGAKPVSAFYSNIDYQLVPSFPNTASTSMHNTGSLHRMPRFDIQVHRRSGTWMARITTFSWKHKAQAI